MTAYDKLKVLTVNQHGLKHSAINLMEKCSKILSYVKNNSETICPMSIFSQTPGLNFKGSNFLNSNSSHVRLFADILDYVFVIELLVDLTDIFIAKAVRAEIWTYIGCLKTRKFCRSILHAVKMISGGQPVNQSINRLVPTQIN